MKRLLSLLIVFVLLAASIGCATPKQKEIDAINEFAASTGTELYSVKYNSSYEIIEMVVLMEGLNEMFADYLTRDELSVENWNSLKEVIPEAENLVLAHLSDLGYSVSISISSADPLSPDVPILISQGGEIVYEATEVPKVPSAASSSDNYDTSAANDSLINDPDGAISVLKEVLRQMESEYNQYAIAYNETTRIIEIISVMDFIAQQLEMEYAPTGTNEASAGQGTMREGLIDNWNMFNSIIRDSGYSVPMSLSISDSEQPNKLLLTISNGEIVYDDASLEFIDSSAHTDAQTEEPVALFENEYIRIFFTDYSPDEGTLSFRVENLTDSVIFFMTPFNLSGDNADEEGFLLIDGAPHTALSISATEVPAGGFITCQYMAAIGPDSDGHYIMETLDADAKTAQFTADFLVCDENQNVLSKIALPRIDLADIAYFPLPNAMSFTAKTLSGEDIDGSYFSAHKLTMVNFWATWCGPCVSEMPDIAALHTEYANKGFAVLGILVWDEGSEKGALDFLLSKGITYPVVAYDTVPLFNEIAATQQAIPFTIFYDSTGDQVGDVLVGSRSKTDWADVIDNLLLQVG